MSATEIPGQGGGFLLPEDRADVRPAHLAQPESPMNLLTLDEAALVLVKSELAPAPREQVRPDIR